MYKLACPRGGAQNLTFSPDGELLAALGPAAVAPTGPTAFYFWTRGSGWEVHGAEPRKARLTGLAVHPGGRTLAYAAISTSIWTTPSTTPPPPAPPGAPPPSVWRRRFAREEPRPFTGIHLHPLTAIDEIVPNRLGIPPGENPVVRPDTWARGLAFTPDGGALLAGYTAAAGLTGVRAGLYHWHFTESDGVWLAANTVAAVGGTERGGAIVGGCLALAGSWGVAVLPVESGAGLYVPDVQTATAVAVAPGHELVATGRRSEASVWHLRSAEPVAAVAAPGWVAALALSPDGQTLAAGHSGGTVSFWAARTGAPGPERDFGVGPVTSLAYAPDGLTLAVAGHRGVVVVDTD